MVGCAFLICCKRDGGPQRNPCSADVAINNEDRTWKDLRASCSLQGRVLYNDQGEPMCGSFASGAK